MMTGTGTHISSPLLALLALLLQIGLATADDTDIDQVEIRRMLQEQLIAGELQQIQPTPDWLKLRQIYHNYGGQLLWHAASGQISLAGAELHRFIAESATLGLEPHLYHATDFPDQPFTTSRQVVLNDLLLTDGFLKLSEALAQGQLDPGRVDPLWKIPVERIDNIKLLDQAVIDLNPSAVLNSLMPQAHGYQQLLQALSDYRHLADQGGWSTLPDAPLIRPGDHHDLVPLLRQRLVASNEHGDEIPDDPRFYDPSLQQSIERFQRSHGLKMDAIIGPHTRAAMNVSVEQRIAQIASNLERWRWLPQQLGDRYILVNIGGYLMQLIENDQIRLEKKAIIGRPKRTTPSFATRVTHLVLNPTWTVPRRIAVEDLLPEQRRDSEYLLRKNIQIQQREGDQWVEQDPAMIDWGQYSKYHFPFRLRQSPGDGNSLGRIKFHMPNPYDIYLHDTPAQGLFAYPVRDFSSGCVRVHEISDLVHQLIPEDDIDTTAQIAEQLESRETQYVKLAHPIDIFLVYFTAWVDTTGQIQFRPDIYDLDRPLILGLQQLHLQQASQLAHHDPEKNTLSD
ncbi:L,D-transpeptidase family protein [Sedimenticola sp.]|uniref:L,D-transpeptidase family protein n=1 Tax=Sedimenticola sp. TaxID=1940285 RepID=UPI003D12860F